jgi:hypothetical protein
VHHGRDAGDLESNGERGRVSKDLSRLFLPESFGRGIQPVTSGFVTAWDAVTHASTIVVGGVVTYTNLPMQASAATTMAVGKLVLLQMTDRGPIIYDTLIVPT